MRNPQSDKQETSDLYVSIPKPIKREVKAIAAKEDKTIAQVVAELLAAAISLKAHQAGAGQ
jgi:hypothetical protein